jgi:hypothetical protein
MADLAGRDYLTVAQAADYACISVSHWRARIQREFPPGLFFGKLIYRRCDVQRFIEMHAQWPMAEAPRAAMGRQRQAPQVSSLSSFSNRR